MLDCLINWLEFNSSWLAPLILAFAAISSFLAAISAKKAAKSNRMTALGQIVNVLEREYESNEMMKAIHRIKKWKKEEGASWIENFIERKNAEDPGIKDVDEARRIISNYFYRYRLFLDLKIIEMKMIREIVKPIRVQLFFDYIDPLEKGLPGYDTSTKQLLEEVRGYQA